jgi:hypothetical protein
MLLLIATLEGFHCSTHWSKNSTWTQLYPALQTDLQPSFLLFYTKKQSTKVSGLQPLVRYSERMSNLFLSFRLYEEEGGEDSQWEEVEVTIPKARSFYMKTMGQVDRIDREIMLDYFQNKKATWEFSVLIYLFKVISGVNSRLLYNQSRHEKRSQRLFLEMLANLLAPDQSFPLEQLTITANNHQLARVTPKVYRKCAICTHLLKVKNTKCSFWCSQCQVMVHEGCFLELHRAFITHMWHERKPLKQQ